MPTSSHEVFGVDEPALPPHAENPDGMLIPSGMLLPAVGPSLSGAGTEPPDPKTDPEPGNPPGCIPPDDCQPPGGIAPEPPENDPPVNDPPEEPPPVEGLPPDWPEGDVCEDEVLCTAKSDAPVILLCGLSLLLSRLKDREELSPPLKPPPPPKPPLPPMEPMAETFRPEALTKALLLRCPFEVEGIVPSSCPRMLCPRSEQ